jgi:hypothetical protein
VLHLRTSGRWWNLTRCLSRSRKPLCAHKVKQKTGLMATFRSGLLSLNCCLNYLFTRRLSSSGTLPSPPSFLRTCVDLAWRKLDTYYQLSDETCAYRLAIVLNPINALETKSHSTRRRQRFERFFRDTGSKNGSQRGGRY